MRRYKTVVSACLCKAIAVSSDICKNVVFAAMSIMCKQHYVYSFFYNQMIFFGSLNLPHIFLRNFLQLKFSKKRLKVVLKSCFSISAKWKNYTEWLREVCTWEFAQDFDSMHNLAIVIFSTARRRKRAAFCCHS